MNKRISVKHIWPGFSLAVLILVSAAAAQNWTSYTNYNQVIKLALDPSSPRLWGATPGGAVLFSWQDTVLIEKYDNTNGLPNVELTSVAVGSQDYKWFGTYGGGIARLDSAGTSWRVFNAIDGLLSDTVTALCSYQDYIFAGTRQGLSFSNDGDSWPGIVNNLIFPNLQTINSIAQRNDTIWVATDVGLARAAASYFISHAAPVWQRDSSFGLGSRNVECIFLADTITIIGTLTGASRLTGTVWQPIAGLNGLIARDIVQQGDSLFFATNNGVRLCHQGSWSTLSSGLISTNTYSLTIDGLGRIWCGTDQGLAVLQGTVWHPYHFNCINGYSCKRLAIDRKKQPWIALPGLGINHLNNGQWEHFNSANTGLPLETNPSALFIDHNNTLWAGNWGYGITRCDDQGTWQHMVSGVPTPNIAYFLQDQRNGVYLAHWTDITYEDLVSYYRYDDSLFTITLGPSFRLRPNALALDDQGSLWIGTNELGLFHKTSDGALNNYYPGNSQLPGNRVNALACENGNRIWIGTESGLAFYDGNNISQYPRPLLSETIRSIKVDRANNKWIGTDQGLNLITWDGQVQAYTQRDLGNNGSRLLSDNINELAIAPIDDQTDGIYIATEKGLSLLKYNLVLPRQALSVNVAPNPYCPGRDPYFFFSNLPSQAVIKIYTLDGRLVGTFNGPAAPEHILAINPEEINSKLVSGLYLCYLSAPGFKPTVCKLAVIR
jgi:hypothetical protein